MGLKTQAGDSVNLDVLQQLSDLFAQGRLAHAYLFCGPKGAGKTATALALAQAVNCQAPGGFKTGCGCSSCRKMTDGNHPDFYMVQKMEDKSELLIEQVRGLIQHLSLRPLEARVRVAVIDEADLLNVQASNAFLKTLEEPRPGTLLILTCETPGNMLKTVLSRCHMVRFNRQGGAQFGLSRDESFVSSVIDGFILAPAGEALLKKWTADKDETRRLLDEVLLFYRDVLCVKNGVMENLLYNGARFSFLQKMAGRMDVQQVQEVIGQALKSLEALESNFNIKVALAILKELMVIRGDYGKSISNTGR